VGPTFALGIQDAVAVDHLVILILEEEKVIVSGKTFLQLLNESFGVLVAIDADCQNLSSSLFLLGQDIFQLAELPCAVGSPLAAVKDQNDALLAAKLRQ
jgi:hypothetical protein